MPTYSLYDATGFIIQTLNLPKEEDLLYNLSEGLNYLEGYVDGRTHRVNMETGQPEEKPPVVTSPPESSLHLLPLEEYVFSSLPNCGAFIDGEYLGTVEDGELAVSFGFPGDYTLRLSSPRLFTDVEVTFEVSLLP